MAMACRRLFIVFLIAALTVSVACHDPDEYSVLSPTNPNGTPAADLLDLTAAPMSIRADGGSRTRIEAHINPSATVRKITFTTTHGTLYAGSGSSAASTTGLDVDADVTGVAAVELQADVRPGTARVMASIAVPNSNPAATITRAIDIQFTNVAPGEVITLTATPATAEADGATRIRIVAAVAATLPSDARTITFTATGGTFATTDQKTATAPADSSNTAEVELVAPLDQGRVGITATVSNFSARVDVTFGRATPDVIFVTLDAPALMIMGANMATVEVSLLRDIGQVSNNTVVTFEAKDFAGTTIGTFSEITLAKKDPVDNTVKATATFDPLDTAVAGVATITAKVGSKSGSVPITLQ
jgi:hypothetical protein